MNLSDYDQKSAMDMLFTFPDLLMYSHRRCFIKIGILKSFTKLTGKNLYRSLFFNNVTSLRLRKCFPVNFAKFVETPFLQNTSWRLTLCVSKRIFLVMVRALYLIPSFRGCSYLLLWQ